MLSLLQALYTKTTTTTSLQAAFPAWPQPDGATAYPAGAFYTDIAPAAAPRPYLVLSIIPRQDSQSGFGNVMIYENIVGRFSVFSETSSVDAITKAELVMSVLDNLILTLSTGIMTNTVRTGQPVPRQVSDRQQQGKYVWAVSWSYVWSISH